MTETIIQLPNGWTLRSEAGDNVRVCDPNGDEAVYWDQNEWHEDPVGVMAAIFGAALSLPPPADNTDSVKLSEAHEARADLALAFQNGDDEEALDAAGRLLTAFDALHPEARS